MYIRQKDLARLGIPATIRMYVVLYLTPTLTVCKFYCNKWQVFSMDHILDQNIPNYASEQWVLNYCFC